MKRLFCSHRYCKCDRLHMERGIVPVKVFVCSESERMLERSPKLSGMSPDKEF